MPTKKSENRLRRHRRVKGKVFGSTERPRLCVFRSLKNTYAQIVDDESGRTLVACSTQNADALNTPAKEGDGKGKAATAKRVGRCLAEKALAAGIRQVSFDRGGYLYHGRVKALAEGAREAGLIF